MAILNEDNEKMDGRERPAHFINECDSRDDLINAFYQVTVTSDEVAAAACFKSLMRMNKLTRIAVHNEPPLNHGSGLS